MGFTDYLLLYGLYGLPVIKNNSGNVIAKSSIDNEYMFQGRRFEKESGLYYYRARHFDPTMGRFLQTDPLGYRDSMNMYQGMNMNGLNFVDPLGNTTYNLFFGFRKKERGYRFKNNEKYYWNFPDWNKLKEIAEKNGDIFNIISIGKNETQAVNGWKYSSSDIDRSLKTKDTITAVVGHGANNRITKKCCGITLDKELGNLDRHKKYYTNKVNSKNDLVIISTCSSIEFATESIKGADIIAVDSNENRISSTNALASAVYLFLENRFKGKGIENSIKEGNKAFKGYKQRKILKKNKFGELINKDDHLVIYPLKTLNFILRLYL